MARAHELLEAIVAESPHGSARAHALARLGWVSAHEEGFHAGADVFFSRSAEPTDDLRLRIEILTGLAGACTRRAACPAAVEHARAALELAEALGDPTVLAGALALVAFLDSLGGDGLAIPRDRARSRARALATVVAGGRPARLDSRADAGLGGLARRRARAVRRAIPGGARPRRRALAALHPLPARAQRAPDGRLGGSAATRTRMPRDDGAQRAGRRSAAIRARDRGARRGTSGHGRVRTGEIERGLALAERLRRAAGRSRAARHARLSRALARRRRDGRADARSRRRADRLRAASASRRSTASTATRSRPRSRSASGPRPNGCWRSSSSSELRLERTWPLTIAARGRGLLALGARRARARPRAALEEALTLHDRLGEPFERARTLLALGSVQRRDRKKRSRARVAGGGARAVRRARRSALGRADARRARARRRPASVDGLTPTEERVAELLASGLTYQQAADTLFVSPKTVQWNVSKIYRKLGIRSRARAGQALPRASD